MSDSNGNGTNGKKLITLMCPVCGGAIRQSRRALLSVATVKCSGCRSTIDLESEVWQAVRGDGQDPDTPPARPEEAPRVVEKEQNDG